jgi:flagellar biosynthetic protein FlhB
MAEGSDDQHDKSEDPTQKRLDDALKRGDVAKSQEVNTWFVIAGGTLVLLAFAGSMSATLSTSMRGLLANSYAIRVEGRSFLPVVQKIGIEVIAAVSIPLLLLLLAAICGNMIQHRLVWTGEMLKPKLSKISPLAGFKRLFSKQALMNFIKGLIKLVLLGAVMTALLWPERKRLDSLVTLDPAAILPMTQELSVAILAFIAAGDFLFQYRQWFERQKMSFHELKEEFKNTDGDPHVKAKIRQIRESRVRKRMMSSVPDATVVIANPTHFAVALKYDRGMNAPVCVAKGMDAIALKIREVAQANGVPVVENPPLARALHATVEIDQEIPAEHYQAVAEVIGYVMKLNRAAGAARAGR